jgi:hydrogenase/urease accessory protein HupE
MFVVPGPWLVGGLVGTFSVARIPNPFVASAWFLLIGGLLAADAKMSLRTISGLAGLLGLYHGYLNGTGRGDFRVSAVALLGLAFGVFVLVALAAAFVVALKRNCMRIAVR